ncbi:MAG: M20/M25/M40 family metallo-hydrolase, partial [Bacteroidales bacterium]|nr:M20/M25/M40 family metallo-hydrolase [Bacteroidales bacterium]
YPDHWFNPAAATAEIIQSLLSIQSTTHFKNFILVTVIHIRVGDIAFGTSPGNATIMATLRAFDDDDMTLLSKIAAETATSIAHKHKLGIDVSFTDEYPASVCDKTLTHTLEAIAHEASLEVNFLEQPNRWSEDFAHFSTCFPSVIFGLGAGENHPDIHTPEYDFPDELIDNAVDFLGKIANKLMEG